MNMICPKCHKYGFTEKLVWYPDMPESRLKCARCEEWSTLEEWQNRNPLKLQHIATKNRIRAEIMRQWDDDECVHVRDFLKIIEDATFEKCRVMEES